MQFAVKNILRLFVSNIANQSNHFFFYNPIMQDILLSVIPSI